MKTTIPTLFLLGCVAALFSAPRARAADLPRTLRTGDDVEMVLVPAGGFVMGTTQGMPEETPPHHRELPAFYIDRTEVTVAQYARFLAATGRAAPAGWNESQPPPKTENLPITNIRWADALEYALWAGKRLPTEAEWEKAARGRDGRRFPWGPADAPLRRNLESGKLRPVGSFPDGASPCGALDLSGNAWEWTADWFEPYPATTARSVHFGHHYKVVRGGAGEGLYSTGNTGSTTQRARLVPYGSHDFIGFRCVKDAPGATPPYAARTLLEEADELLRSALRPPRALAHETQFAALNAAGEIPLAIVGTASQTGLVTMGFPLPRQRARATDQLELLDARRQPVPLAATPLALWPDGSIRWALLQFAGASGQTNIVRLYTNGSASRPMPHPVIRIVTNTDAIRIDTGALEAELSRAQLLGAIRVGGRRAGPELRMEMVITNEGAIHELHAGPAESLEIESQSPLHADVRWRGRFVAGNGAPSGMTYDLRLRAAAGSAQLRCWLTVLHAVARQKPWEDLKPQVGLRNWRVVLQLPGPAQHWIFGGAAGTVAVTNAASAELRQPDDLQYTVSAGETVVAKGTRAPGWFTAVGEPAAVTVGLRHFWQNHPQALWAGGNRLELRLWRSGEPFAWEGGLAKTHEFVIEVGSQAPAAWDVTPLRAVADPVWLCGSEAAGALLPRNDEALRHFAYWECWREDAMRRWANAMPTGLRDFGDGYMGGPYKGKNAYMNLEYDVPMDFLFQFLRTGQVGFLESAEVMARHQADIDTENVAGFAWKHSPSHTTTEAEFGHVFLRGLLLHHLLTGERRSREMAERVGDWIAQSLKRGQGVGNERQIGWSLYALSALYEITRKPLHLEGAQALCSRLAREQAPTGKFNIRWDNRIAFFNGIAMSGMLQVDEIAPDPALETALLRVADRTLGMYPEYACRTLNAYCWAVQRTRDPRLLHNMERTWLSSLEFLLDRDPSTSETHAWRFPSFAIRYDLFPQFARDPGPLPLAATWQSLRLKNRAADVYVHARTPEEVPLLIVREGLAGGQAELFDADGKSAERIDFADAGRLMESRRVAVPARSSRGAPAPQPTPDPGSPVWFRLRLSSADAYAWQVHHDHRIAVTFADPKGEQLSFLLPRAVGEVAADAKEVTLRFEATGEGFHRATLYDAAGVPVGRVQRFIDFGDPGRYELELKVPVTGPRTGWSLELTAVKVVKLDGFMPYWAASATNLFNPEGIQGR